MIDARNVDSLGAYSPIRGSHYATTPGPLNVANATLELQTDGDESALISVQGTNPVMTVVFEGTIDGINWVPVMAVPFAATGGTAPHLAQPVLTETYAATVSLRVYAVRVAQLLKVRIRVSAYTSGAIDVSIRSDCNRSIHPGVNDRASSSLLVTNTGAAAAAVTLTIPSVAGLRHYLDFVKITRFAAAVLTAAAAPVVVTSTNLPGPAAWSLPADAAALGTEYETSLDFGGTGLAASAAGTNTTIVLPATTGVIWRVTASYRLGL